MVRTAEYFDSSANPAHIPAASHQARPRSANAFIRHNAAPSNAQFSGPSGSTQVALVIPSTGDIVNATAAHSPARSPHAAVPKRNNSQVDNADRPTNGSLTVSDDSPRTCAAPHESHHAAGG